MNQLYDITMTDRSGGAADHQLLSDKQTDQSDRNYIFQHASGQTGDPPAGVFDNPPVVDIFEGITGDLLLVRAAPPILIPEQKQEVSVTCMSFYNLLIGCCVTVSPT